MHRYFIGIGGIGMSALARYFMQRGEHVGGYDRVRSDLTQELESEGAVIHYEDNVELIPDEFRSRENTVVIFTPAVPETMTELAWFRECGFEVMKRSKMLERIADNHYVMAVSGTHGKTTTATMTAWFNRVVTDGGSAFLGGISKNFCTNLVVGSGDRLVVEADEYDRSFLRLYADAAVVTATDADHLDIYGDVEELRRAFSQFIAQIRKGGTVVIKSGVEVEVTNHDIDVYHYSMSDMRADFRAENITVGEDGHPVFDVVMPDAVVKECKLGVVGTVNVENALAATALLWIANKRNEPSTIIDGELLRHAIETFAGVKRRFDIYVNTPLKFYMDDYAHHPEELRSTIRSVREMFPARRLTVVFQPHLYSRTRDFAKEFSQVLSLADEVILLPVYPAREEPINGVSSEMLAEAITVPTVVLKDKRDLVGEIASRDIDMLITFGAGDIDSFCEEIAKTVNK